MSNPVLFDMEEALSAPEGDASTQGEPKPEAEERPDSRIEALKEALKISESARMDLLNRAVPQVAQPAAQQPPAQKWFSREELREMLNNEDPDVRMQAVEISSNQAIMAAASHFEQRMAPLTRGSISSAEAQARQRYAAEFELFGDQITSLAQRVPDQGALATAQGWDHLVTYVRGQPENIDKLYDHRAAARAREAEIAQASQGFTPTPNSRSADSFQMDDGTRQVAQTLIDAGLYKNIDEYVRDMRAFNNRANG